MGKKTIETIDCRIWSEPDERHRVKQIGMKKCGEVFEELKRHLEGKSLMPDEYLLMSHRLSNETLTVICRADEKMYKAKKDKK